MTGTFAFAGYDIPVRLINMTRSGTDLFGFIGNTMLADLQSHVGLRPDHTIVEIGCGVGRCAIPASTYLSDRGVLSGQRHHRSVDRLVLGERHAKASAKATMGRTT